MAIEYGGFPLDTYIPHPDGIKKMRDLRIGDVLFAKDGSPTKIVEIKDVGAVPTYRVKFRDDRIVYCAGDQTWSFLSRDMETKLPIVGCLPTKIMMNQMHEDDFTKYFIDTTEGCKYSTRTLPLKPELMGAIDGNPLDGKYFHLMTADSIADQIAKLTNTTAMREASTEEYFFYDRFHFKLSCKRMYRRLGISPREPFNQRTPELLYLYSDVDQITEYLSGMWSVNDMPSNMLLWVIYYKGKSEYLANAITYRTRAQGLIPYKIRKGDEYFVFRARAEDQNLLEIVDISEAAEAPCRAIRVDHPSHTYLVEDFNIAQDFNS